MVDDEVSDGGQLGKGVGPDVRREAPRKLAQHLVTRVMAKCHQKRAEKDLGAHPLQARSQALRSVHEHVVTSARQKGALEARKRGLALQPAVPGEGHDAAGSRGQGLVERGGYDGEVLLARKQGRREAQRLKSGRGVAHRRRRRTLQPAVRHVRRDYEGATHAPGAQLGQDVRQGPPHGTAARSSPQHRAGTDRRRKLFHKRGHARVVLLARQAAGYDQGVGHASDGRRAPRP